MQYQQSNKQTQSSSKMMKVKLMKVMTAVVEIIVYEVDIHCAAGRRGKYLLLSVGLIISGSSQQF